MRVDSRISVLIILVVLALALTANMSHASQQVYRGKVIINSTHPRATLSDLKAFLIPFIPNATVNASIFINETVNGFNYTIMQINGTGTNFIVFNMSNLTINDQSFVLDEATNIKVLSPYLIAKYYPNSTTLNMLTTLLQQYQTQAQPPLVDCLTETGLANFLCPVGYNTTSCLQVTCQTVPICNDALQGRVGKVNVGYPTGFIGGIMNFSFNYSALNSSYKQYYSLASSISKSNITTNLQGMQNIVGKISTISVSLPENPLFPVPANISIQQQQAVCTQYQGITGGPYYCYSTGFCENTQFNTTKLNTLQSQLTALLASPISNSTVASIAIDSANNGARYFEPEYIGQQTAAFDAIINESAPSYNALIVNMSFILTRYKNASLQTSLSLLNSTFSAVLSAGINQNLTAANAMLGNTLSSSRKIYEKVYAQYVPTYNLAFNTTSLILLRELDYETPPASLGTLATEQSAINLKLNKQVNATTLEGISSQEQSINAQARGEAAPFSLAAFVKAVDKGYLAAVLSSPTVPYASKVASAPLYAALLSLLIGIIIMLLIYFLVYYRLSKKNKIKMNPRVKRTWIILFSLIFVLVLIYMSVTYVYAQGANQFLPASGFITDVSLSNTTYIMINQTLASNVSVQQCVASLDATLKNFNKTTYNVYFTGSSCTLPTNKSITGNACFNYIVSSGKPTMIITPGNSTIVYRGLYGDTGYASGAAVEGYDCPLNQVARVA